MPRFHAGPLMSANFPPRRLAKSIVRQLRLKPNARLLDVGCGQGDVVGLLRRAKIDAFGLFDGAALPVDDNRTDVPKIQPATLHQSIPFLAQSFDAVIVRQTQDYEGPLSSPEACTATANLLAALKPGGQFVYCGPALQGEESQEDGSQVETNFAPLMQHLAQYPGEKKVITLGTGGLMNLALRLTGLAKPGLPALLVTIPAEPISRLEWHRIAREAVAKLTQPMLSADAETSAA